MSSRTMDEAAKVLADPTAYADDDRLHTALTELRADNPVAWVDNPPYRPFWAITKHEDIMAIERANDLFLSEPRPLLATADADDVLKAQIESRHRHPHPGAHGRPAPPQGAGDRRRLVPAEGHARPQDSGRRTREALRRHDARDRTGMRLRHRRRAQLPSLRDPFAARAARRRLPANAQVDPGDVRRRRRRASARRFDGGPAGRSGRLLRLLQRADGVAARAPDRRPGIGHRQRPASTASICRIWTPSPTT